MPLWAGVPSAERAARLLQHLHDPASFGTPMPLPSVARGEPSFEKDMWRGPVWLNTAYAVIQGLLRYGFERDAAELAYRLCDAVYSVFERERRIYEFYDPDRPHTRALRRKRGNWWKALTLGRGPQREFVGWTGLVNNLLLEVLLGLDPQPPHRTLRLRLPPACESMALRLDLPAAGLGLQVQVLAPNRFAGTVSRDGRSAGFEAGFAEPVDLDQLLQRGTPCATAT
jgi:glycogen debranching enzyme